MEKVKIVLDKGRKMLYYSNVYKWLKCDLNMFIYNFSQLKGET